MKPVERPTGIDWSGLQAARDDLDQKQAILAGKDQAYTKATDALEFVNQERSALDSALSILSPRAQTSPAQRKHVATVKSAQNLLESKATNDLATAGAQLKQAKDGVATAEGTLKTKEAQVSAKTRDDFEKKFGDTLNQCHEVIKAFQDDSKGGARAAFWIQIAGLAAGAVAAPALTAANAVANKAWTAGLAGFAGSTNLAESTLGTSGLNGIAAASTANQLASKIATDIASAQAKTDFDQKYDALDAVVADCSIFQIGLPAVPPASSPPPPAKGTGGGS
jgi:hypothetical protein